MSSLGSPTHKGFTFKTCPQNTKDHYIVGLEFRHGDFKVHIQPMHIVNTAKHRGFLPDDCFDSLRKLKV